MEKILIGAAADRGNKCPLMYPTDSPDRRATLREKE